MKNKWLVLTLLKLVWRHIQNSIKNISREYLWAVYPPIFFIALRVSEEDEIQGLDLTQHNEMNLID